MTSIGSNSNYHTPEKARSVASSREDRTKGKHSKDRRKEKQKDTEKTGSVGSPLSIIEQWQKDARGAVEDAYANYVLGDDTGESARLVLVASPADDLALLENSGQGKHPPHILLNDGKGSGNKNNSNSCSNSNSNHHNNSLLLLSHREYYTDANRQNSLLFGRRAHNKHDPHAASFASCGVTFVEINGRAYVHALDEHSEAYRSGVRPKDCVQYAAVLAKEWEDPLGADFDPISSQAMDREESGQRITYEELKRVFLQGSGILGDLNCHGSDAGYPVPGDPDQEFYHRHRSASGNVVMGPAGSVSSPQGFVPPLPTTIRIAAKNPCGALLQQETNTDPGDESLTGSIVKKDRNRSSGPIEPSPVVLVFRRTRQRPPRAWNMWPNYRLDDECEMACQILESLTVAQRPGGSNGKSSGESSSSSNNSSSNRSTSDSSTARVLFSTDGNGGFADGGSLADDEASGVEASTLRGMVAKSVGLAFVRSNKVVFGVSLHGGSGIVLARLSDGTWSAPSLIGMGGVGLGLQVGLEVASYIFVLQTREALEHFSRGGSFTLGANVGAALASMGREAIGAASVSGALCGIAQPIQAIKEDEYNFEEDEEDPDYEADAEKGVSGTGRAFRRRKGETPCHPGGGCHGPFPPSTGCAGECSGLARAPARALEAGTVGGLAPVVAYATSKGLYVGVSLEGSRLFARQEANARAYKYESYNHKAVTARDILTGKIAERPPEAEPLYALLHAIELAHDWSLLLPLPEGEGARTLPWESSALPVSPAWDAREKNETEETEGDEPGPEDFADRFRSFLFGGITVTRLSRNRKREQRTLWLSSPAPAEEAAPLHPQHPGQKAARDSEAERGSLRVGFVSKLYPATAQRKHLSASLINDVKETGVGGHAAGGSFVSDTEGLDELTLDSALLDNQSLLTTTGTLQERVELSKKLSMDLVDVLSLTQSPPPDIRLEDPSERNRIVCLESADGTRLVFVGKTVEETRLLYCGLKILLEKETARMGIRGGQQSRSSKKNRVIASALRNGKTPPSTASKFQSRPKHTGSNSSGNNNGSGYASSDIDDTDEGMNDPSDYYNASVTAAFRDSLPQGWKSWGRVPGRSYMRAQSTSPDDGYPTYAHGQLLIRDICKKVILPLPLPLCRVLLLDSSSPVVSKWETERGDSDFERTPWTFPPATPREMEQFQSEHQLIASGSMCGAHRTISYERFRNGRPVRLSETHIVDSDDSDKLAFQVNERLPRRGFSIKVNILLRAIENGSACEATVLGEIRPVGKNMSDPEAVHKALLKVLEELRNRYGTDYVGLMAGFMSVVENMPKDETKQSRSRGSFSSSWRSGWEEKKEDGGGAKKILGKTSVVKFEDVMNADVGIADLPDPRFAQESRPSNRSADDYKNRKPKPRSTPGDDNTFASTSDPVTIEVKPLPKIRLSLMPSPREEDEENLDDEGEPKSKQKTSSSSRKSRSSASKKRSLLKKKKGTKREI